MAKSLWRYTNGFEFTKGLEYEDLMETIYVTGTMALTEEQKKLLLFLVPSDNGYQVDLGLDEGQCIFVMNASQTKTVSITNSEHDLFSSVYAIPPLTLVFIGVMDDGIFAGYTIADFDNRLLPTD